MAGATLADFVYVTLDADVVYITLDADVVYVTLDAKVVWLLSVRLCIYNNFFEKHA